MAWVSPHVFGVGEVLTASEMNNIGTDLNWLYSYLTASTSGNAGGVQTTSSTSYTSLTGGPSVTLSTATTALVIVTATISNASQSSNYVGYAVSSPTSNAASDTKALTVGTSYPYGIYSSSIVIYDNTLTSGVNTFTLQYKTNNGTASFSNRSITVIPLN